MPNKSTHAGLTVTVHAAPAAKSKSRGKKAAASLVRGVSPAKATVVRGVRGRKAHPVIHPAPAAAHASAGARVARTHAR